MAATLMPDFSITLNQRRWACVLDPTLALSDYGLPLVKQLGELMELWVVREFWHILDNTHFYLQQPESILGERVVERSPQTQQILSQQVIRALKEWERLRTTTERSSWNVHFLADVIGESCIPGGIDSDIIWRWESLAQSLDHHIGKQFVRADTLTLAFRDLVSLAAARPASILTYRLSEDVESNLPPAICTTLETWGIPCQAISSTDSIAAIEREQLRNLLVHAGLAKLLWSGLNLVVVHLMVPAADSLSTAEAWSGDLPFSEMEVLSDFPEAETNLWEGARAFWYCT